PSPAEIAEIEAAHPDVSIEITAHAGDRLSQLHGQDNYSYRLATVFVGAADEEALTQTYRRVTQALRLEILDVRYAATATVAPPAMPAAVPAPTPVRARRLGGRAKLGSDPGPLREAH